MIEYPLISTSRAANPTVVADRKSQFPAREPHLMSAIALLLLTNVHIPLFPFYENMYILGVFYDFGLLQVFSAKCDKSVNYLDFPSNLRECSINFLVVLIDLNLR